MNDFANTSLQLWQEKQAYLKGINADTPQPEYEQAMALCTEIHKHLREAVDRGEYTAFLATYADICAAKNNLDKEIEIQDEIVTLRTEACAEDRAKHLPSLSKSLRYAGMLHRKNVDVFKAIECMEQHLACEREIGERDNNGNANGIATALYLLANTYNQFGRNILAEDTYTETVEAYYSLADKSDNADTTLILAQIIIEFANFYLSSRMVNNAIDRYVQAMTLLRNIADEHATAREMLLEQYQFMQELYTQVGNAEMSQYYAQLLADNK